MGQARLLGERYEVGELLGRGGTADVRIGRDVRSGRTVAVKTLRSELACDPAFQARFRREARFAASLEHASIVSLYDTGEYDFDGVAVPYMVMEYVDGQTLRAMLHTGGRLLPRRALRITAETLGGLAYSHDRGIVHRDIKPGNVMLTGAGAIKVMDFGIACHLADASAPMTAAGGADTGLGIFTRAAATISGSEDVVGTPQYLSPEQARGEKVDPRSDLYSIGCLLYELLTGCPPFTGDVPVVVVYQHVTENPTPPSLIAPLVTPAIDAVVLKALAKNRDDRYQSAAQMLRAVERCIADRAVAVPEVIAAASDPFVSPRSPALIAGAPRGGAALMQTLGLSGSRPRTAA